jgi:geranylgeranyl pyrophosphate synthase
MDSEPTERDRWRANERTGGDMSDTATLNRLFAGIEADLVLVDRAFQERTASDLFLLNSAVAHVLSSPGKRLRTALTLLSGKLIDYRFDKLLPLSLSLEMVHLATLVHDDIVDKATTRRGIPTVNAEHGDAVAILLGDYLFAKTSGIVAEVEDFRVDRLFADTVARICEGTIIELLSTRRLELSIDDYLERISRKTACLMAACCKGGAIVCGGSDAQIALMQQYGQNLGVAFQIIDDVLDYAGSEATIGKPTGNDLRQGLITLPLIYALQAQNNGHTEEIREYLLEKSSDEDRLSSIIHWVAQGPGIHAALEEAERFGQRARDTLSIFPASKDREVLEELTFFVLARWR